MIDVFIHNISLWMQTNPSLSILACLIWGLCSVALSPCQLATISFLSTPQVVNSSIAHKIPKLMLGHALALFGIGLILILFSFQLNFLGHYWTVPFGILFLYMTKQLLQTKHCTHCAHEHTPSNFGEKILHTITKNSWGFIGLGFAYGTLSSTCALVFLAPVLLLAKGQDFIFILALNTAFAVGHTLPIFIVSLLANSIHKLMCASDSIFVVPRRLTAIVFALAGLILIAHPLLELAGFDFHGHGQHEHNNEHNHSHHDEHNHHNHDHDTH